MLSHDLIWFTYTVCCKLIYSHQLDINAALILTFKNDYNPNFIQYVEFIHPCKHARTHTSSPSYSSKTHDLTVPAGHIRPYDSLLERKWHEQDRKQRRHHIHNQVHFCSAHTRTQHSSKDADVSSATPLIQRHTQSWTSEDVNPHTDAECVQMTIFQFIKHFNFWSIWKLSFQPIFPTIHSNSTVSPSYLSALISDNFICCCAILKLHKSIFLY